MTFAIKAVAGARVVFCSMSVPSQYLPGWVLHLTIESAYFIHDNNIRNHVFSVCFMGCKKAEAFHALFDHFYSVLDCLLLRSLDLHYHD